MRHLVRNLLGGCWQTCTGSGTPLSDPALGEEHVRVDSGGLCLAVGFAIALQAGAAALRSLSYTECAILPRVVARVLKANRDGFLAIPSANSGTVATDTGVDLNGTIYTLDGYVNFRAA